MSVRCRSANCMLVLSLVLVLAQTAPARDWTDMATTPFADPLLTRPSQLDSGTVLPGDIQAYTCNDSAHDASRPLGLADAIDLALCHNPQVYGAWSHIKAQAAQAGEARAAYLPTLNAGVSYLNQRARYSESESQNNIKRTTESRFAALTWRLLDFGGRGANRRLANALLEAALASHDATLQRMMATVIGLYFEAQTANAGREAKEKHKTLARQTLETAQKREARGAGAQSDTLQARSSLLKAELEHTRAVGVHEKSLVTLGVALGLPLKIMATRGLILAPDYQDEDTFLRQDLSSWLQLAQEQHPAVVSARAKLEAAQEKVIATRSEGLPTLDFTLSKYVNGRPSQGLSAMQARESAVGFTLNIPLFDGFGRTYKVLGAEAQVEIMESELQDIQHQVLGEVAKAHADAAAAFRNLESSRLLLDAAQEALENVRRKYDQGISDILEMLSVQGVLADAEQERIRALAEWRSARLRLLAHAGLVGSKDVRKAP